MHHNNLSVAILSIQCYNVFTMIAMSSCITHPMLNTFVHCLSYNLCYKQNDNFCVALKYYPCSTSYALLHMTIVLYYNNLSVAKQL